MVQKDNSMVSELSEIEDDDDVDDHISERAQQPESSAQEESD